MGLFVSEMRKSDHEVYKTHIGHAYHAWTNEQRTHISHEASMVETYTIIHATARIATAQGSMLIE